MAVSEAETVIEQIYAENHAQRSVPLPDAVAEVVVAQLKDAVDRYWWTNPRCSVEFAHAIMEIGQARGDQRQIALGMMALGDSLKLLGQLEEAWQTLEAAGDLFQQAGDEVGWARTRIGRLAISADLNRVPEATADLSTAAEIFTRHDERERLLRLHLNTGTLHNTLGDHERALAYFMQALVLANTLGAAGENYTAMLNTNIGYAYTFLGDLNLALKHYQRAHTLLFERGETSGAALAELNIAVIAMSQGDYRRALLLLHRVGDLSATDYPLQAALAKRSMVECFLFLNRYAEARQLARQVLDEYRSYNAAYETALTLVHLATAEAYLGQFDAAEAALVEAEQTFTRLDSETWAAAVQLRRGRIALQRGNTAKARAEADTAAKHFLKNGRQVNYAQAVLLGGQSLLLSGNLHTATEAAQAALKIAQKGNMPSLRHSAHLLLGHIHEQAGNAHKAKRSFTAADATIERVQRGLTITLRPGFLEDKGEALRGLMRLHLAENDIACAFDTLERTKSQALLGYLANRQHLHWNNEQPEAQILIEELQRLRGEHHWYYNLAHNLPSAEEGRMAVSNPDQALSELAIRERKMRAISERLYLLSAEDSMTQVRAPSLEEIQAHLADDTLMIEFYSDGCNWWAFTVDAKTVQVHALSIETPALDSLLKQLQFNISCALKSGAEAPAARSLTTLFMRTAKTLGDALIAPLATRLANHRQLVIVPYGALHYLPFHLLYDGAGYLVERCETVIIPSASLLTRRSPRRSGGARVLAHPWDGRLTYVHGEAEMVQRLFGGQTYMDSAANREALAGAPSQILHIAAHGEYRIDQPDLSYIQLADGQLYTDDLLQHDLSYELVTMSACETGRANVSASDELIGLGRGFLYAGAGALIASLWRIDDGITVQIMEQIYRSLRAGRSKAAALRQAQQDIIQNQPQLHPAFWGAFQLIGDASPLST